MLFRLALVFLSLTCIPSTVMALERVSLQLRWDHSAQFAGYYAAEWQGFYEEAGLDVEIRGGVTPEGGIVDAVAAVARGEAIFGVGAANILDGNERRAPLTVLASIFQDSPAAFFALPDTPLFSPADLLRLRVARRLGDFLDIEMQAMLRAEGIDPARVAPFPYKPGVDALLARQIDVTPGYTIAPPDGWRPDTPPLRRLRPRDFGIQFYGDSLFTTRETAEERSLMVERFLAATLRGWTWALQHPEKVAARIARELTRAMPLRDPHRYNQLQMAAVVELSRFPMVPAGNTSLARWQRMQEHLVRLGLLDRPSLEEAFVFDPAAHAQAQRERLRDLIRYGGAGGLAVVVLLALWTTMLRRRVAAATTRLVESREQLRSALARIESHVANTPLAVIEWSPMDGSDGTRLRIRRWSGHATAIFGWEPGEMVGRAVEASRIVVPGQRLLGRLEGADTAAGDHERLAVALRCRTREGRLLHCRWHHSIIGGTPQITVLSLIEDVTELVEAEQRIRELALHDPLTGLPNRRMLTERLEQGMQQCRALGRRMAVMILDLDGFKEINDTLGHEGGDALLRAVAARAGEALPRVHTLARMGGDEFAVLQTGTGSREEIAELADRLLARLSEPFAILGREARIGASCGIALFPDDGDAAASLFRHADLALYRAKAEGRNKRVFFTSRLSAEAEERRALEDGLRLALRDDQLELHYQPVVDLGTGRLAGAEALLRWHHPRDGLVLPGRFIAAAESLGLIRPMGAWVIRSACRQARRWLDAGVPLRIAVNISANQLEAPYLPDTLRDALEESGLPPHLLELEITESQFVDTGSAAVLREVAALGLRIAIDDFGAGYSSLAYLARLPVDRIKIDRAFIDGLGGSGEAETLIRAVVSLGHSLGKRVVAEGIETRSQLAFLAEAGCDEGQGYLFGRPAAAARMEELLRERPVFAGLGRDRRRRHAGRPLVRAAT